MTTPASTPRQRYQAWVEEQLEEYKAALDREELLDLAEQALADLFARPDGQYPLTEILLCDAVDRLLIARLDLPAFRAWQRACRSDTHPRPRKETPVRLQRAG